MKRILIKCGWLVTLDPKIGEMKGGELLLPRQSIEAVGRNLSATADEIIDATDKIVMPGLVNAHMHTWETALRGIGAEWMSADYFKHVHSNLATRYKPEDNYIANLIGALAQIDAGVTTLVDWCHNITTLEHAERAIDGLVDSGIRAVFAHGTAKPIGPRPARRSPISRIRAIASRRCARAGSPATTAASRSPWRSSARTGAPGRWSSTTSAWRASSVWSRRRTRGAARTAWCRTATRAWPRPACSVPTTTWSTARATTHADLRVVVDSGATLTSTVLVELHHHIGDTMVAAFREAGGQPSLGIDVELYCSGQMFREMQAALLFARGKEVRNNALRGNSPLKTIPVRSREALEWATINGARRSGSTARSARSRPARRPTSSCCAPTTSTWRRSTTRSIRSSRSPAPATSTPSSSTASCASRTAS